jgi:hypothetical protein
VKIKLRNLQISISLFFRLVEWKNKNNPFECKDSILKLGCGSSGRVFAQQAQGPQFNP